MAPGEIESRAFDMFERGMSIRRVVIMLRITSEEAWALRERWLDADSVPADAERATKRQIEIDADVHAGASDAELEEGIEAALDAAADVAT